MLKRTAITFNGKLRHKTFNRMRSVTSNFPSSDKKEQNSLKLRTQIVSDFCFPRLMLLASAKEKNKQLNRWEENRKLSHSKSHGPIFFFWFFIFVQNSQFFFASNCHYTGVRCFSISVFTQFQWKISSNWSLDIVVEIWSRNWSWLLPQASEITYSVNEL